MLTPWSPSFQEFISLFIKVSWMTGFVGCGIYCLFRGFERYSPKFLLAGTFAWGFVEFLMLFGRLTPEWLWWVPQFLFQLAAAFLGGLVHRASGGESKNALVSTAFMLTSMTASVGLCQGLLLVQRTLIGAPAYASYGHLQFQFSDLILLGSLLYPVVAPFALIVWQRANPSPGMNMAFPRHRPSRIGS